MMSFILLTLVLKIVIILLKDSELRSIGGESVLASLYFFLMTVIDFKLKIHRLSDDLSHQNILLMLTYTTSLHISCHTLWTSTV